MPGKKKKSAKEALSDLGGFTLKGSGWAGSLGVAAVIISFVVIVWLLFLTSAKTDFEADCEFEVDWVMIGEGEECWLYDAYSKESEWVTKPGDRDGLIWQMKWSESKHCPLPKNIKCSGSGSAKLPYLLAQNLMKYD